MGRAARAAVAMLACAAAGAGVAGTGTARAACAGLESGPARTVTRVIDGETVVLDDGTELRLAGALAPRGIDADAEAGAWPAELVTVESLRALVLGKSVAISVAAGERSDRYGRVQAQAFVVAPDGRRRWVQGALVAGGLARAYASGGERGCSVELLAAERGARAAGHGLWREAAYRIRSAGAPAELARYRATFQVVEGQVLSVAEWRGTIYLRFARNWRRGFSVSLRRGDREMLGRFADAPRGLEGQRVRVRGWIEAWRQAPMIDLSAAGALEVLADAAEPRPEVPPEVPPEMPP